RVRHGVPTSVEDAAQHLESQLRGRRGVVGVGGQGPAGSRGEVEAVQCPVAAVVGDDVEGGVRGERRLQQGGTPVGGGGGRRGVGGVGGQGPAGARGEVGAVQCPVAAVVGDDVEGGVRGDLRLQQGDSPVGGARGRRRIVQGTVDGIADEHGSRGSSGCAHI